MFLRFFVKSSQRCWCVAQHTKALRLTHLPQAILEKIPKFRARFVNIGLLVTAAIFLIILLICFPTFGWVVDYKIAGGSVDTTGNKRLSIIILPVSSIACPLTSLPVSFIALFSPRPLSPTLIVVVWYRGSRLLLFMCGSC